jgi:hypothetical protein
MIWTRCVLSHIPSVLSLKWHFQALVATDPSSDLYGAGVKCLRRWCRTKGHLPSSCMLSTSIVLDSQHAISSSALSDIYRGEFVRTVVAVKTLRIHMDNQQEVRKVRLLSMGQSSRSDSLTCSPSGARW